ncbi:MAG TPA: tRNA pseudouridine(55) synthase TruB [Candidatus Dormibacteraeota bacterium]|nr:tRNA pseudouridine(55) synthase TruB [Candidatus Dormibacteraeota bacterium]
MAPSRSGGLDGVLVVDKPAGPTSHDVVALVRRLAQTRRIGHGGTLDPFATGVLPLFLGSATRLAEYHLGGDKGYRATVCLGASSTTDDLEGELTPVDGPPVSREAFEAALAGQTGTFEQRPPAYSAVKIAGRHAYALARAGAKPQPRPRTVSVARLDLVEWDGSDPERPIAVVEVACSAGTYVRAIARDLGAALGSGAYLGALTRTRSGAFTLEETVRVDDVRAAATAGPEALQALVRRVDAGLESMASAELTSDEVSHVVRGQAVRPAASTVVDGPVRLLGPDGRIIGIGAWSKGRLGPEKILVDVGAAIG